MNGLFEFLNVKMSMSEVYQPAIVKALLENGGKCTKEELAAEISQYDNAAREYYAKIVMRYPKTTLMKHGVVSYDKSNQTFSLTEYPSSDGDRAELILLCKHKIQGWQEERRAQDKTPLGGSKRYQVLRNARGKCELCGISSEVAPIDVDHIIPQSKAKKGKVFLDGHWIGVHDLENLQALCSACNRGKRDSDQTDFRRRSKLVRDRIPEIIEADGRIPNVQRVGGKNFRKALFDKLTEEHAELLAAKTKTETLEELADMLEVISSIANSSGCSFDELLDRKRAKHEDRGGFDEGWMLSI